MIRNVVGFAGVAVVAMIALKLLGGLFGFAISIFLVLRVISPSTADRVRDTIRGNKAAE